MNLARAIDFGGGRYRRLFRDLISGPSDGEWSRTDWGGLLCLNSRKISELPKDLPAGRKVHYCGVESDDDIRRALAGVPDGTAADLIFVARIRPENLYDFGTGILDRANVLFVLDYVPDSVEERHHAFNLFHKSLLLRRIGAVLYYYHRVVEMLTMSGELPATPPAIVESLGFEALLYQFGVLRDRVWQKFDLWHKQSVKRARANAPKAPTKALQECRHAVITGWYGTETAGDKAILLEIIHVLRERAPGIRISVTSIVPGLSLLTNLECDIDAEILELRCLDYGRLSSVDLVVFGGGPMMDSSQLKYIETLFGWARRRGVATMAFGCGVGPLKTKAGTQRVKSILANTDQAFFRDRRSAELALELGFAGKARHACDPAMRFVSRWSKDKRRSESDADSGGRMVTLLRAQTTEYSASAGDETDRLQAEVSGFISEYLSDNAGNSVQMLPMHTFWFGNDDRDYMRIVANGVAGEGTPEECRESPSLDMLLRGISEAAVGLPMRFHGHVFMLALNIPFISINYTGAGGKVFNLIKRFGLLDYSVALIDGFEPGTLHRRMDKLKAEVDIVRQRMRVQLGADLAKLESIYDELFGKREPIA